MQNPGATLTELAVPSEVLGLDSLQRQALNSRNVRMARVDDSQDPAKMLEHVPAGREGPRTLARTHGTCAGMDSDALSSTPTPSISFHSSHIGLQSRSLTYPQPSRRVGRLGLRPATIDWML